MKIEKIKTYYLALELNEDKSRIKFLQTKRVAFDGFNDQNIISCLQKDSIELASYRTDTTFNHDVIGTNNTELINSNVQMTHLAMLKINSSFFSNQKIKISYTLIRAHYCKGVIADRDLEIIGGRPEVILIIDELSIDNNYRVLPSDELEILKAIDFNTFMF
ncbi:hypothetical protein ACLI1A_01255 [Flavobacterium sp. RHBU_3]|uniref:hypothetical protein n=1 Tax=Flavobacterium sp. RHBU_3 TaxID=3391184 RepID=UPI00398481C5